MSDWGHESEDLFRAARQRLTPSAAARARVRAGIRAKLAGAATIAVSCLAAGAVGAEGHGGTTAGVVASGTKAVASKGVTAALLAKIVVPLAVVGVGVVAVPRWAAPLAVAVVSTERAPAAPRPVLMGAVVPVDGSVPQAEAIPSVDVAALPNAANAANTASSAAHRSTARDRAPEDEIPVAPAAPAPAPAAEVAVNPQAPASDEATLVGEIDAALRAGDSAGALRLAAFHQRLYPSGNLTEEREGARVVARCMAGTRSPEAADAFLAAHPRSPMRARIGAACGTEKRRP